MEEFALVEADFQQYYQLNLDEAFDQMLDRPRGFLRYARLFAGLPPESRIMKKLNPVGSWSWKDETLSRILYELSSIQATLYNTNRKKGAKALKPDEQYQPDYVDEAKKAYQEWKKEQEAQKEDIAAMDAFWKARNPDVKFL